MKIDVSKVLKAVGNEESIKGEERISFPEDNLILTKPISYKFRLVNTGRTILLRGEVKTTVKLSCCRCLKDFDYPLAFEVEEEYSKRIVERKVTKKGQEIELKDEDFIFKIEDNNTIDLTEMMRQNILVNLPIKPLCDENCKGLDSGKKSKKDIDPRLLKLKDFLKKK